MVITKMKWVMILLMGHTSYTSYDISCPMTASDNETRFKTVKTNMPYELLYTYIREDYGFPPAVSRSLAQDFQEMTELYYGAERAPGQIIYNAASADVPAGTIIDDMKKVPVRLTVFDSNDISIIASEGPETVIKKRIQRIILEAYEQGGTLTQADVAAILGISPKTVMRKKKELQADGTILPTRGNLRDIGPSISHKTKIVELYLRGNDFMEISRKSKHSDEAISRYLKAFSRYVILTEDGFRDSSLRMLTGHSEKLLNEYRDLYDAFSGPEYEKRMEKIRQLSYKKNEEEIPMEGHPA